MTYRTNLEMCAVHTVPKEKCRIVGKLNFSSTIPISTFVLVGRCGTGSPLIFGITAAPKTGAAGGAAILGRSVESYQPASTAESS